MLPLRHARFPHRSEPARETRKIERRLFPGVHQKHRTRRLELSAATLWQNRDRRGQHWGCDHLPFERRANQCAAASHHYCFSIECMIYSPLQPLLSPGRFQVPAESAPPGVGTSVCSSASSSVAANRSSTAAVLDFSDEGLNIRSLSDEDTILAAGVNIFKTACSIPYKMRANNSSKTCLRRHRTCRKGRLLQNDRRRALYRSSTSISAPVFCFRQPHLWFSNRRSPGSCLFLRG